MNHHDEDIKYIEYLISRGEGLHLDFKYNISDSRKIAKSLVAFANTAGGTLLIGVKDNGAIAGITSEEELFMLEAASDMYTKPVVNFSTVEWNIHHKTILEVTVDESKNKPHLAENEDGKWLAYLRHHDQNILANSILVKVWEREQSPDGTIVRYKKEEEFLLNYLKNRPFITIGHFCSLMHIPRHRAEKVLVNLIALNILKINYSDNYFSYSMTETDVKK